MSKTQPLPLRSHGQVGEEDCLPQGCVQNMPGDHPIRNPMPELRQQIQLGCCVRHSGQWSTQELVYRSHPSTWSSELGKRFVSPDELACVLLLDNMNYGNQLLSSPFALSCQESQSKMLSSAKQFPLAWVFWYINLLSPLPFSILNPCHFIPDNNNNDGDDGDNDDSDEELGVLTIYQVLCELYISYSLTSTITL